MQCDESLTTAISFDHPPGGNAGQQTVKGRKTMETNRATQLMTQGYV